MNFFECNAIPNKAIDGPLYRRRAVLMGQALLSGMIALTAVSGVVADELEARAPLQFGSLVAAGAGRVKVDPKHCIAQVVAGMTSTLESRKSPSQCAEFVVVDHQGRPSRKAFRVILPTEARMTNQYGQTIVVKHFTHNLPLDADGYSRQPNFLLGGTVIVPANLRPSTLEGPIPLRIEFKDEK